MKTFITVTQIIFGILTIAMIFLQTQGDIESNSNLLSTTTVQKRGWEKVTFIATIITTIIFLGLSIAQTLY